MNDNETALDAVLRESKAANKLRDAAPDLLAALKAIRARIHGDFDSPELLAFGPLKDRESDLLWIVNETLRKNAL